MLRVVTAYAGAPLLSLEELKAHLREEQEDTANDAGIAALGVVALEMIETETQRRYGVRTLEWVLPSWRPVLALPVAPIVAVDAVRYTGPDGSVQALDPSEYVVAPQGETRRIAVRWGHVWPCVGQGEKPVAITFRAGADALPARVRQAALMIVSHLYDNRAAVVEGGRSMGELPMGVEALISAERWS